ncbi:MAG: hypothetical protein MK193_02815 [Lentisphaeria bacterium]|nr:hypothetical protein [Lentisphaeria bacterium]
MKVSFCFICMVMMGFSESFAQNKGQNLSFAINGTRFECDRMVIDGKKVFLYRPDGHSAGMMPLKWLSVYYVNDGQGYKKAPVKPHTIANIQLEYHDPYTAAVLAELDKQKVKKSELPVFIQNMPFIDKLLSDDFVNKIKQYVHDNPEIIELMDDPEFIRMVKENDQEALQKDPRFQKLIESPDMSKLLKDAMGTIKPSQGERIR